MANIFSEQKLIDNNDIAFIKYTGILDTDINGSVLIDASNLANSLNANGQIMVSNTHPLPVYDIHVKKVWGDASLAGGYIRLHWDGDADTTTENIIIVGSEGYFNYDMETLGYHAVIPNNNANTTGDILISAADVAANDTYTLFVLVGKNGQHYSQGQHVDPAAFNSGNYGI